MRLCLLVVVMFLGAVWLPARVHAQVGTDVSPVIPVHPDVMTILRLPDEIAGAWSLAERVVQVKGVGNQLYVQPRPDTPAGVEALIEVETRTLHRIFHLRVVERAEDATPLLVVFATMAGKCVETASETSSTAPAPVEASASTPIAAANPTEIASDTPEPAIEPATPEPVTEPANGGALAAALRFELSVHVVAALAGMTALDVAGYVPDKGRRAHRALSLRLAAAPPDTWWSLEANIGAEWLDAPMVYVRDRGEATWREFQVSGPWLQAEIGLRARAGTRWMPTAYAALGLQAHLSTTQDSLITADSRTPLYSSEEMTYAAVLTLGLGLQYQARNVLLGVDFQVRQGVPMDYRSVDVLLSVGFVLDRGE
ncbi:MAG TPA: hypothetical protein VNM90_29755 [Haliangium sp.]|nr:hypothetical protein [Haliangium sp.]